MPGRCYVDQDWFDRELERIFRPGWLFAARADRVEYPGDYVTVQITGVPLIVMRGSDGVVRAFVNSCRHRGSQLLDGDGTCARIKCPVHHWTYTIDGDLRSAPGTRTLPDFDRGTEGLTTVACQMAGGFVFVRFAANGPELDEYLGSFTSTVFEPYRVDRDRCVHHRTYTVESNWKTYVEIDMETLHTDFVHPDSIGSQPVELVQTSDNWVSVRHTSDISPALAPPDRHSGFPAREGLAPELRDTTYFSIVLPGFFVIAAPDVTWWINKSPISPTRTRVDVGYCFPPETVERDDFDTVVQLYIRRLDQVIGEDDRITEVQQKGIAFHRPGRYCEPESMVHRLDSWILDRMADGPDDEIGE